MKITKKQWLGSGRFADEAARSLESQGIAVATSKPFNPKVVGSDFSINAVAMTEFGRLDITIRDWIRTRFELPSEASKAVGCNPHSGKWNFHFDSELFLAQKPEDGGQDYIGECVGHFARNLDFVGAREWVTAPVIVSPDEIDEHSRTYWDRRKAMGDDIETSGFDSEAAKDWLADKWFEVDGSTTLPAWNRAWISNDSDVNVHFHLKDFAGRNPGVEMPGFYSDERTFATQGIR